MSQLSFQDNYEKTIELIYVDREITVERAQ